MVLYSLLILSIGQALFLGFILIFISNRNKKSSMLLGILLFFLAYDLYEAFCYFYNDLTPFLPDISNPLLFIYGPLIFMFVKEIEGSFTNNKKDLVLISIYLVVGITAAVTSVTILYYIGYFQLVVYLILSLIKIRKTGDFFIPILLLTLLGIAGLVMSFNKNINRVNVVLLGILTIIYLLLVFRISYLVMTKNSILKGKQPQYNNYKKGKVIDKEKHKYLLNYITEKQFFLDPDLSQSKLANELGFKEHYLSFLINNFEKCNFQTFINKYRIKWAEKLLKERDDITITEIFYDSGFNSKSTFNKVFKETTGKTPSQYKKGLNL